MLFIHAKKVQAAGHFVRANAPHAIAIHAEASELCAGPLEHLQWRAFEGKHLDAATTTLANE